MPVVTLSDSQPSLRPIPIIARMCALQELRHILPWSLLAGLVEGQFAAVVISRSFHGGELLIAVASATPFAARLFSLFWGMLCIGRRKIPLMTALAIGTVLSSVIVVLIPRTLGGAVWFLAQMAMAQIFLSGVVTVRSAVWRSNYPYPVRGQITAKLQHARIMISVVATLAAARICDRNPDSFRYVFLAVSAAGAIGAGLLPRLRVRGEGRELRRVNRVASASGSRDARTERLSLRAIVSPGRSIRQMIGVLRDDRRFAWYCFAQFCLGLSNIMTIPIVVALVTRDLPTQEGMGFWYGTGLIVALPNLVLMVSIHRWARMFDRHGVLEMRVLNVACWLASLVFGLGGALVVLHARTLGPSHLPLALSMFAARGLCYGLGTGGGAIAWYLGHLHFAEPKNAELYMGLHVSLTGVRGLIAPLGGIWLWQMVETPAWLVAIGFAVISAVVFVALARTDRRAIAVCRDS